MVDTRALHGVIVAKGETQRSIAEKIGMPLSTFCDKCGENHSIVMICSPCAACWV